MMVLLIGSIIVQHTIVTATLVILGIATADAARLAARLSVGVGSAHGRFIPLSAVAVAVATRPPVGAAHHVARVVSIGRYAVIVVGVGTPGRSTAAHDGFIAVGDGGSHGD